MSSWFIFSSISTLSRTTVTSSSVTVRSRAVPVMLSQRQALGGALLITVRFLCSAPRPCSYRLGLPGDVLVIYCFLPSCHLTLVLWESEEAEQCVPGCPEVPRLTAGAGFCRQTHTPGASSELAEAQPLEGWNKHAFP